MFGSTPINHKKHEDYKTVRQWNEIDPFLKWMVTGNKKRVKCDYIFRK